MQSGNSDIQMQTSLTAQENGNETAALVVEEDTKDEEDESEEEETPEPRAIGSHSYHHLPQHSVSIDTLKKLSHSNNQHLSIEAGTPQSTQSAIGRASTFTPSAITSARTIHASDAEEAYMKKHTEQQEKLGLNYVGHQVASYHTQVLDVPISMCLCFRGSLCSYLCSQKYLLYELLIYCCLYFGTLFTAVYNTYNFIPNAIVESSSLGGLVSFLLGLYIALNIARWWRLRTEGVGGIWDASSNMATLIGACYRSYREDHRQDRKQLIDILERIDRIKRYCQLSLALIFEKYGQEGISWDLLVQLGVTTEEQKNDIKLRVGKKGSYPQYVWNLIVGELVAIDKRHQGFFPFSTPVTLHQTACRGRTGAGLIEAQMNTQLPLTYAHGITVLCKVYNCTICVIAAVQFVSLWAKDLRAADPEKYTDLSYAQMLAEAPIIFTWNTCICFFFVLIKAICISLLLLFCSKLSCPFDDDVVSFPGVNYLYWISVDFETCLGFDVDDILAEMKEKLQAQK